MPTPSYYDNPLVCAAVGDTSHPGVVRVSTGTTAATWTSPVSGGNVYQPVPLTSGGVLAGGWYNIGLASLAGGSVNAHGLYLTV